MTNWHGWKIERADGSFASLTVSQLPGRKRPSLTLREGNQYVMYETPLASFSNAEKAQAALDILDALIWKKELNHD